MVETETVPCNLCGSTDFDLLGIFCDAAFGLPGQFPYVTCRSCGLIYLRERPLPAEMGRYYPPEYQPFRTAIQDEPRPWMRWARRRNIAAYCQVVEHAWEGRPGRILDVGCSTGIFLDAMRQRGWQAAGVETSPQAVQFATQRFGLEVFQGQLREAHFSDESFDAITLWNVFEHLYDPRETLEEIHRLLRPGGSLVMMYPSYESLDRRLFGDGWVGFDAPRHLFVYPRPVARRLVSSAGLALLRERAGLQNYYAFAASLERWLSVRHTGPLLKRRVAKVVHFPGVRFLVQPLISFFDRTGLGATVILTARKELRP